MLVRNAVCVTGAVDAHALCPSLGTRPARRGDTISGTVLWSFRVTLCVLGNAR